MRIILDGLDKRRLERAFHLDGYSRKAAKTIVTLVASTLSEEATEEKDRTPEDDCKPRGFLSGMFFK